MVTEKEFWSIKDYVSTTSINRAAKAFRRSWTTVKDIKDTPTYFDYNRGSSNVSVPDNTEVETASEDNPIADAIKVLEQEKEGLVAQFDNAINLLRKLK